MQVQRVLLGLVALTTFGLAAVLTFTPVSEFWSDTIGAMAWRVGILLGVLWLALPQVVGILRRVSRQTLMGIVAAGLVLLIRPKFIYYVVPLLGILFAFQFLGNLTRTPTRPRTKR